MPETPELDEQRDIDYAALMGFAAAAVVMPAQRVHGQALQAWREARAAGEAIAPSDDAFLLVLETIVMLGDRARAWRQALERELRTEQDAPGPRIDDIPEQWQ
jgi:hypothetical protein